MNYFGAWLCGIAAYAMRETFYERLCSLCGGHMGSPLQLAHARYLLCKYAGVVVFGARPLFRWNTRADNANQLIQQVLRKPIAC